MAMTDALPAHAVTQALHQSAHQIRTGKTEVILRMRGAGSLPASKVASSHAVTDSTGICIPSRSSTARPLRTPSIRVCGAWRASTLSMDCSRLRRDLSSSWLRLGKHHLCRDDNRCCGHRSVDVRRSGQRIARVVYGAQGTSEDPCRDLQPQPPRSLWWRRRNHLLGGCQHREGSRDRPERIPGGGRC